MTYRAQDKAESAEGSQSCKLSWMDTPQSPGDRRHPEVNSCLFKQRDSLTNTEGEATALRAQSSGSCEEKVAEHGVSILGDIQCQHKPTEPLWLEMLCAGVQQGNILPASDILWSFKIPFKHNFFDQKRTTKCPNLSNTPQRQKKLCVHRPQGKFRTLLDFAGD